LVCAAETSEEIGADRVEDVVAREGELVDQIEGHLWAGDLGDHDSAVEGDDRGWGDCEELLVPARDHRGRCAALAGRLFLNPPARNAPRRG
jgi:hypothetical protein